jgi:hypothetical protein
MSGTHFHYCPQSSSPHYLRKVLRCSPDQNCVCVFLDGKKQVKTLSNNNLKVLSLKCLLFKTQMQSRRTSRWENLKDVQRLCQLTAHLHQGQDRMWVSLCAVNEELSQVCIFRDGNNPVSWPSAWRSTKYFDLLEPEDWKRNLGLGSLIQAGPPWSYGWPSRRWVISPFPWELGEPRANRTTLGTLKIRMGPQNCLTDP